MAGLGVVPWVGGEDDALTAMHRLCQCEAGAAGRQSAGGREQEPSSMCLVSNTIQRETFREMFPVGASQEHSFHPLTHPRKSVRAHQQRYEVNEPV